MSSLKYEPSSIRRRLRDFENSLTRPRMQVKTNCTIADERGVRQGAEGGSPVLGEVAPYTFAPSGSGTIADARGVRQGAGGWGGVALRGLADAARGAVCFFFFITPKPSVE